MTTATPDGRHRRSEQSRQRIIDAIVDLVHEGVLEPTAEQVSDRAGLAMRTVFRHFNDMDSLYREISRRIYARVQAIAGEDFEADSWQTALRNLIDRRTRVYEEMMPLRLSADALRHRSAFLQEEHRRFTSLARDILRQVLPRELSRDRICFESLDALLSFEMWIRIRRDQRLSAQEARKVLQQGATALLTTTTGDHTEVFAAKDRATQNHKRSPS